MPEVHVPQLDEGDEEDNAAPEPSVGPAGSCIGDTVTCVHRPVFTLSPIYTQQESYSGLTMGVTQAMYLQPPRMNLDPFLAAVAVYYDDLVVIEPALLKLYHQVLLQLDSELGES